MSEKKDQEKLLILKFENHNQLKQFYRVFEETEFGDLLKVGDRSDYNNNKTKDHEKTLFSRLGLEKFDEKTPEKASMSKTG